MEAVRLETAISVSQATIRHSFDEVTRLELQGRRAIASRKMPAGESRRHDIA